MARKARQLRIALLLSVAFSANIGGTGTLIGSTPQLALKAIVEEYIFCDFVERNMDIYIYFFKLGCMEVIQLFHLLHGWWF